MKLPNAKQLKRFRSYLRAFARGAFWRLGNAPSALAEDAEVTFAIPLIGKASAYDWDAINKQLAQTLASLLKQTNPNWSAIVCGQDEPDVLGSDNRVSFIKFTHAKKIGAITDKYSKVRYLLDDLDLREKRKDAYLFFLDADDIIHPNIVEYMLSRKEPGGYVIDEGYIMDALTGDLGYYGPPTEKHPYAAAFYKHCGSCAAIRMDRTRRKNWKIPFKYRGQHSWQIKNLSCFGLKLRPINFGAAVYVVNHGENTRKRRGKMDGKIGYLKRNLLTGEKAERVRQEFLLDTIDKS